MPNHSRFSINLALNVFNVNLTIELSENPERQLVNDSRLVKKGDIFVATIGHLSDGRDYIEKAIELGAELIIAQTDMANEHSQITKVKNAHVVYFYELTQHLFSLASLYYQQPSKKLVAIGITGTNGKTTTSQIVAQLLDNCGQSCAVIGTTGAGKLDALKPINNTTPGPTELNALFSNFVSNSISHVAMEVSSHALDQHRINPSVIDIAVFTNLSRDHLDYHQTMEKYADAKFQMFTQSSQQIAIVNGDDETAKQWLVNWSTQQAVFVYGLAESIKNNSYYLFASNIKHTSAGVEFLLETHEGCINVQSSLVGDFNISNVLASAAVLLSQKFTLTQIALSIAQLSPVIGRMETFTCDSKPTSIVDYAHTPDALENALVACREHCQGDLWVVFGCGGDRDNGKRALMGTIAEQYSDRVVVTNDNPRTEKPTLIASDILKGCKFPDKVEVILDRKQAVLNTLAKAKNNDTILFAGKGHEDYIVIGTEKIDYNERELIQSVYVDKAAS
jgi:UDP-N-acetylmuramoyl-L-alanyl-D-glutamate--2,6-diaminopimelate ligase